MVIELTTDNAIAIASILGSIVFGLWARSLSAHNKLSEQRSETLKEDIEEVKKDFATIEKQNNDLRDCLQETRENYVTNARFEAFVSEIKSDIKAILAKLDIKHDKADCRECRFTTTPRTRKSDTHD
jgi:arginyl-tRNA synthetase